MLSEDKTSHLSHLILGAFKRSPLCRLTEDEGRALREIKRVLASELALEESIDRKIRARLASYSRPIAEGSTEWEVLYKKAFEEEQRKQGKS
jgi:hypothetical protein